MFVVDIIRNEYREMLSTLVFFVFVASVVYFAENDWLGYFDPPPRRVGLALLAAACALMCYWGLTVAAENADSDEKTATTFVCAAIALPASLLSAWMLFRKL